MNKLRKVKDGKDLKQWKPNSEGTGFCNPKYGNLEVYEVWTEDGVFVCELPILAQTPGVNCFIIRKKDGFIAMIRQDRPVVLDPEGDKYKKICEQGGIPDPLDFEAGEIGMEVWSFPRGFMVGSMTLEAREETPIKVVYSRKMANTCSDTANEATSPVAVLVVGEEVEPTENPDPDEVIHEVVWVAPEDLLLKLDKTICAKTTDTVTRYLMWVLTSEDLDPFLLNVAKRIVSPILEKQIELV